MHKLQALDLLWKIYDRIDMPGGDRTMLEDKFGVSSVEKFIKNQFALGAVLEVAVDYILQMKRKAPKQETLNDVIKQVLSKEVTDSDSFESYLLDNSFTLPALPDAPRQHTLPDKPGQLAQKKRPDPPGKEPPRKKSRKVDQPNSSSFTTSTELGRDPSKEDDDILAVWSEERKG